MSGGKDVLSHIFDSKSSIGDELIFYPVKSHWF